MLKSLARMQVLILDDWGITPLTAEQRRDLLEIVNDRHGRASGIGAFRWLGPTQTASKFPQVPQIVGKRSWIGRFAGLWPAHDNFDPWVDDTA
jgi:IstB-like ATP binding protein